MPESTLVNYLSQIAKNTFGSSPSGGGGGGNATTESAIAGQIAQLNTTASQIDLFVGLTATTVSEVARQLGILNTTMSEVDRDVNGLRSSQPGSVNFTTLNATLVGSQVIKAAPGANQHLVVHKLCASFYSLLSSNVGAYFADGTQASDVICFMQPHPQGPSTQPQDELKHFQFDFFVPWRLSSNVPLALVTNGGFSGGAVINVLVSVQADANP